MSSERWFASLHSRQSLSSVSRLAARSLDSAGQGYSTREIAIRPLPRRKQRGRKLRCWTTRWNYTHLGTFFLPSVPSPRIRPRPSGLRQSQVHRNPSPWLPASRRWNGRAPMGRTTAGRGRLNASEGTAKKDVTSLRGITRHVVTAPAATGERASGPGQVPLVGPARVDVPSPAVSRRRRTPVRRVLPLAIISIILQAIVDPSHLLHHGRLQTASLSPVTVRDDETAPTGRVGRLSPDGMSSYLLRSPRPLRNALSRWLPRRLDRFILNRPQQFQSRPRQFQSRPRQRTAQQVRARQQAAARPRVTSRQRAAARSQATTRPQGTARLQATAQPQGGRLGNRGRLGHSWRPCHSGRPDHNCGYRLWQPSRCLGGGVIT